MIIIIIISRVRKKKKNISKGAVSGKSNYTVFFFFGSLGWGWDARFGKYLGFGVLQVVQEALFAAGWQRVSVTSVPECP